MRVLHIVRQYQPSVGGLEEVVAKLAAEQQARGTSVKVLTLDRIFAAPAQHLPAREMLGGIAVIRVPYVGSNRYPIAPGVLRHLGEADLVHVHAIDFFFDFLALTRLWHAKPMLVTTHGGFFHTQAFSKLKQVWFNTMTRGSARAFDAVVACSVSDLATFERLAPRNLRLIENGVDIAKFAGCASRRAVKNLVTIGRFSENKRLDRLLDAMRELVRRDPTWQLSILGSPSDWTLERLRREIVLRQLDEHVDVAVGLDSGQIALRLAGASLFVSASEHEGFGLVLIEALSAGLLPVVHANDAFRSLADRLGQISLTDFTNPGAAAKVIEAAFERLARDGDVQRRNAQGSVSEFDWTRVAGRYLDLYDELLGSKPRIVGAVASPT